MEIKAVFLWIGIGLYLVGCAVVAIATPWYIYQQGGDVLLGVGAGLFAGLMLLGIGLVLLGKIAPPSGPQPVKPPPPPRPIVKVVVLKEKKDDGAGNGGNAAGLIVAAVMISIIGWLVFTAPPLPVEPASQGCIRMYQEFRVPLGTACPQTRAQWAQFVDNHVVAKTRLTNPNWTLFLKSVLLVDCPTAASPSACKLDVDGFLTVLARYKK